MCFKKMKGPRGGDAGPGGCGELEGYEDDMLSAPRMGMIIIRGLSRMIAYFDDELYR